jgi:hypothetical protein
MQRNAQEEDRLTEDEIGSWQPRRLSAHKGQPIGGSIRQISALISPNEPICSKEKVQAFYFARPMSAEAVAPPLSTGTIKPSMTNGAPFAA